ncbi:MAG: heme biosynthesis HemY N-terminal domain-containing protein [Rhizobiaceae bacterium]
MIRIFIFLALVMVLGFGFAWFADRPGDVTLRWQGMEYETSLMVVVSAIVAVVAFLLTIFWLISTVLRSPGIIKRFFTNRRRDKGYSALSEGLISAGAGDVMQARVKARESRKLLGEEPLVGLLEAQTLLLEGDRPAARKKFSGMLNNDQTKLIALRGLHFEAEHEGAMEAARHYAEEASAQVPALPWAASALLRYQSQEGDWEGAMRTLEMVRSSGKMDREEAARKRAALLTAEAMEEEPAHPEKAVKLAKEANKLAPDLVPAAVVGATAMVRHNDIRRAAKLLESTWKKQPHPDLAEAYVNLRSGDSVSDRLSRAQKLAGMAPDSTEGNMAVAQAAIATGEFETARKAMDPVISDRPSQRACMIMADLEEAEYGDRGRMRDWLARAVRAPRDPVWIANGRTSARWLPVSPLTGEINAFKWEVPEEQLAVDTGMIFEQEDLRELSQPLAEPAQPAEMASVVDEEPVVEKAEDIIDVEVQAEEEKKDEPTVDEAEPPKAEETAEVPEQETEAADSTSDVVKESTDEADTKADTKTDTETGDDTVIAEADEKEEAESKSDEEAKEADNVFPLKRLPDDPGIDEEPEDKKGFKLF